MKTLLSLYGVALLMAGCCLATSPGQAEDVNYPDPERYAKSIDTFQQWDSKNSYPTDAVLFVGSSSIRLWSTAEAFGDEFPVINRGFGGSILADSIHYADRIILKYKPVVVVLFAGTNDVNRGIPPAMVHRDFVRLVEIIHTALPRTEIIYLSITPTRSRWPLWQQMQAVDAGNKAFAATHDAVTFVDLANAFLGEDGLPVKHLFVDDQLHLSPDGYAIWNRVLAPVLRQKYRLAMNTSAAGQD